MLSLFGNYFYAKKSMTLYPYRDIDNQRILQSDLTGTHFNQPFESLYNP